MIFPDFETFKTRHTAGKTQLVWTKISADMETPVSAYLKVGAQKPYSFLLESVEGGTTLGRYSIIGTDPNLIWTYQNAQIHIQESHETRTDKGEPLTSLRSMIAACAIDHLDDGLPPMAASGLFGYMGYDMVRLVEDIPDENPDTLNLPESVFVRPSALVIFDNVKSEIYVVYPVYDIECDAHSVYEQACAYINTVIEKLQQPLETSKTQYTTQLETPLSISSNMEEKDFHAMVEKAVEYIHAGEIFQGVLSQRFSVDFDLPAFALYRSLRRLNPSPFLFYMNFEDFALVGSSPEILVRVRDNTVTIRPIAGTRKRGKDEAEDKALAEDLLNDPKERAEHLMLLDLGRNDVGKVSDIGSVNVTDQFTIENYSHVMHIVSNVEGTLKADLDVLDALFSGFPAGTTSGAPKIRAMEIIDELEPVKRSYYAGCVGYIGGNRTMDTCIALRTSVVKDGKVFVQAGGGVVADSTPDFEYQESVNKARAIMAAAEEAVQQALEAQAQKKSA